MFDAAFLALRGHRRDAEVLGQLLAFEQTIERQKGLHLPERVAEHIRQAVATPDQAGDGGVPVTGLAVLTAGVKACRVGASRSAAP